ncbi:MAG: alpha-glucan family phosphorylase [Limisphaerales bacterium]|nr:MAG: alpha-glucan family phosphorylase [Limisphaerales bacterium]|tara:strand:- start:64 stop:2184 length:2121 start_codon:yes stop_codon:yes gene_type:complete
MNRIEKNIVRLNSLARNLWWTWNQDAQDLFESLSPRAWQNLYHNAVAVMRELSNEELHARMLDNEFSDLVESVLSQFEDYLKDSDTWAASNAKDLADNPVAYFSAEFGFHETLPIAAGGLGMLAGDHTKSASDLGLGFVGISLFYREGYFQQSINKDNWQTEYYSLLDPINLPLDPLLDVEGNPVFCEVEIANESVQFCVWKVNVGRCSVYLIDANLEANKPHFRDLTKSVYGGDNSTRIMQEILLGVGGVRLLRKLGIMPSLFHMNEGHAAFLVLELMKERIEIGDGFNEAFLKVKSQCLFTTHTPVPAGHDRFSPALMDSAARHFCDQLKVRADELLALGRVDPSDSNEDFCMTVLALKGSRAANGVSELHGVVSREMWSSLYPNNLASEVPIGHITNGIHLIGWMKGTARKYWRHKLERVSSNSDWSKEFVKPEFWALAEDTSFITDEEIWSLRYRLRRELIEFSRRKLHVHDKKGNDFISFDHLLNPDALTIGFARRFATYKRAPLIFDHFESLVRIVKNINQPVQFIFAGKAHPRDDEGKKLIQKIIHLSKNSDLKSHLVFLENYDVHVARQMVSGCDVWLNNPRRPLEASGTSGMKTTVHGCLNMSILDGWWREGFDGTNGFSIGSDTNLEDTEEQDRIDSENLYNVLCNEVIPCFYDRDVNGIPRAWIAKIRRSMATLAVKYDTTRMVRDYTKIYYLNK